MSFVVIVIALLLVQWWGSGAPAHRDGWFFAWRQQLASVRSVPLRLVILVAVPGALVWMLGLWWATAWYGLPWFLLALVVLLYSLGRGDFCAQIDRYLEAWRREEWQGAYEYARELGDLSNPEQIGSAYELHDHARAAVLYRGLERWFSVVFWFVIGGPAVALVYRLLQLACTAARQQSADDEHALLHATLELADWLPARLLGLSFALTGHFGETMRLWRERVVEAVPTPWLLVDYERAAVLDPATEATDDAVLAEVATAELREISDLLVRSVVLWVVVLALFQLA